MQRAVTSLLIGLLVPSVAFAHLGGLELTVPLWSIAGGALFGLVSLAAQPRKRWLFLALPVLAATSVAAWKMLSASPSVSPRDVLLFASVFGAVFLAEFGAAFGLVLLASSSLKSIRASWASVRGKRIS